MTYNNLLKPVFDKVPELLNKGLKKELIDVYIHYAENVFRGHASKKTFLTTLEEVLMLLNENNDTKILGYLKNVDLSSYQISKIHKYMKMNDMYDLQLIVDKRLEENTVKYILGVLTENYWSYPQQRSIRHNRDLKWIIIETIKSVNSNNWCINNSIVELFMARFSSSTVLSLINEIRIPRVLLKITTLLVELKINIRDIDLFKYCKNCAEVEKVLKIKRHIGADGIRQELQNSNAFLRFSIQHKYSTYIDSMLSKYFQ